MESREVWIVLRGDPRERRPLRRFSFRPDAKRMAAGFACDLYFAVAALTISATKSSTFHSLPINTFCTLPCASTTTVRKL